MSVKPFGFFLLIATFLTITANGHPAQAQTPPASAPAQTTAITSPDTAALKELKGSVKRCSELQDRGIRMSCYDRLAQSLGFLSAEKIAENEKVLGKIGFWDISSKNGIDGVVQTTLRLESSNTVKQLSGDTERHVALVIRCTPGKTEVFLDWKKPVVSGSYVKKATTLVTYFVNGSEKINEDWEVSTDQQALFVLDPAAFIRNIMKKQKLTIGFTSMGSFMQNATFDITGAEAAVDVIVKTCY
jgi:hypothetical protein